MFCLILVISAGLSFSDDIKNLGNVDREVLVGLRTAHLANLSSFQSCMLTFDKVRGRPRSEALGLEGKIETVDSRASGRLWSDGRNCRYEKLFALEDIKNSAEIIDQNQYRAGLMSTRAVTDGRDTILDLITFNPRRQVIDHAAQISKGLGGFKSYMPLGLIPTFSSEGNLVIGLARDIDRVLSNEAELISLRRDEATGVVEICLSFPGLTRRYRIDTSRGHLPLEVVDAKPKGEVLRTQVYRRLVDHGSSHAGWFPLDHIVYSGLGPSVDVLSIAKLEANVAIDPREFALPFDPPVGMADEVRALHHQPRSSWGLIQIPRAGFAGSIAMGPVDPTPTPRLAGVRPSFRWGPFALGGLGFVILIAVAVLAARSRSRRATRARGFTIVELIVVIGAIGLLTLLLLGAVQRSRESARRLQCVSNLRQIALAFQSYAGSEGYFPAVCTQIQGPPRGNGQGVSAYCFSPFARSLNHLEQSALFNSINFALIPDTGSGVVANLTATTTAVGLFVCPSDPARSPPGFGRCNYRCSLGPTHRSAPYRTMTEAELGPFTVHHFYRPADFADGLSNTVGLSERRQGDWVEGFSGSSGDYPLATVEDGAIRTCVDAVKICRGLTTPPAPIESRGGESWFFSGFHFTLYNHCATPNAPGDCGHHYPMDAIHDRIILEGVFAASSHHATGVNAAMMDGSVRFVADGISAMLWRSLGTRSSGEVVSSLE